MVEFVCNCILCQVFTKCEFKYFLNKILVITFCSHRPEKGRYIGGYMIIGCECDNTYTCARRVDI